MPFPFRGRLSAFAPVLLVLVLPLLPLTAAAGDAPLTLREALQRALTDSPSLALHAFHRRVAEAERLQAGIRPAPELSLEVENIAGSGELRGVDGAETTLALSQLVELGDRRGRRLGVAEQRIEGVERDYALARLEVLGETARRFVEAAQAQALRQWSAQAEATAQRALAIARERAEAGGANDADVARFELGAIRAQLARARSEAAWRSARTTLAASWGAQGADFESVSADLTAFPPLPTLAELERQLERAPRLQQLMSMERLQQSQLRLAESGAAPDLRVGLGVRRFEAEDDHALVLSFSLPLFGERRNRGALAAAEAQLARTGAEQQLAQVELRALLRNLYGQLVTTRDEALQLRARALPSAERALRALERGYRAGRFSALELIAAQDEWRALQRDAIGAESAFHLQLIELERLTGQPLTAVAIHSLETQP
jgi:cobalt-zinc-cadmium efflux system outer membrane protein